jgi:curved DNA-binding protein CbpA
MSKTKYEVLEVPNNATLDEIKKAYKAKAVIFHPDKNKSDKKKEAELKFLEISDAYQTLSDEKNRKAYDDSLKNAQKTPPEKAPTAAKSGGGENQNDTKKSDESSDKLAMAAVFIMGMMLMSRLRMPALIILVLILHTPAQSTAVFNSSAQDNEFLGLNKKGNVEKSLDQNKREPKFLDPDYPRSAPLSKPPDTDPPLASLAKRAAEFLQKIYTPSGVNSPKDTGEQEVKDKSNKPPTL